MVTHDIGMKAYAHRVVRMVDGKVRVLLACFGVCVSSSCPPPTTRYRSAVPLLRSPCRDAAQIQGAACLCCIADTPHLLPIPTFDPLPACPGVQCRCCGQ